ncbi:acetate uptake transporter [Breoghania sp.]|uniref:acetate uptake transporter n=1 Tax=Breoghania sp. TaxID=2065378 RepID=UPI0026093731|nr:acetate uptake transporter [Breoghania sp.]MDJ0931942.1 acetate uptake transporter [Breoghania sp.]
MGVGTLTLPRALQMVFLSLWITFALLAAGDFTGLEAIKHAGGYAGLLTAVFAFYLAAAEVSHQRDPRPRDPALRHAEGRHRPRCGPARRVNGDDGTPDAPDHTGVFGGRFREGEAARRRGPPDGARLTPPHHCHSRESGEPAPSAASGLFS